MKLEPYPQAALPETMVQRVTLDAPVGQGEFEQLCRKHWEKVRAILVFDRDAVINKWGFGLNNDVTQTVPHTHSWAGYLHFKAHKDMTYWGSSVPTVFCDERDVPEALRAGYERVAPLAAGIRQKVTVAVTDAGWPGEWIAAPEEHAAAAFEGMKLDPSDPAFHQACARLRKMMEGLPLFWGELLAANSAFALAAQRALEGRAAAVTPTDGETIAFPPHIGHFRFHGEGYERHYRENPRGGKFLSS